MEHQQMLAGLIARHAPGDGVHAMPIPGLALIRSAQPTEPLHVLHSPALCIVAQGAKLVMLAEESHAYDPAKYLVVSVDLPVAGHVTEASAGQPYLCMRLDLDPAALAALLMELPPAQRGAPDEAGRGLALSTTTPELLDAAVRLLRLLDRPAEIPILAPLAVREIHYRLLVGEQGAAMRHIALAGGRLGQVSRAIAWIKRHYAEPFRVETVAREAGMSASALHEAFKAVTAMSPLQYQKRLRLQEARRLMVAHALDAARAGFEVGYESPSQFSREYGRLFGAPPARDAARLRAAPAGALEAR